jgi:hypothetical protein
MGSLPTFAAFAHETNVKLEGEWRQCGQSATVNLYLPIAKSRQDHVVSSKVCRDHDQLGLRLA